jgi:hypothetical protein
MRINVTVTTGLFLLALITGADALEILSVKGNRQVCGAGAADCVVVVTVWQDSTVTGGCQAAVKMQKVSVKAGTPVTWSLAKEDMSDMNVYEFADNGIKWEKNPDNVYEGADPAVDAAKAFDLPASAPPATTIRWFARNLKDAGPIHAYSPKVRIRGATANCKAGDPKINNDGG